MRAWGRPRTWCAAMFAGQAGIEITPIAYKGAGPAMNDR